MTTPETLQANEPQHIYIVVGQGNLPYWIDRKLGRLINWFVGKDRATILSENEFEVLRKGSKCPFIVIGGPDANEISKEIYEMYPTPIHVHFRGKKELFFIQGGMVEKEGKYEVFDVCLLIWGRRIRDTLHAIWFLLAGEGKTILSTFVNYDWTHLPASDQAKWKAKYWNKKPGSVAEEPTGWPTKGRVKKGKRDQQQKQAILLPPASIPSLNPMPSGPDERTDRQTQLDTIREMENARRLTLKMREELEKTRRALRTKTISKSDLIDLVETCRFKNGTINYSLLGKRLGVSYKTAQANCRRNHIK